MIRTNFGTTEIKGSKAMVMTDLSMIVNILHFEKGISKDDIMRAVEMGFISEDEINEEAQDMLADLLSKLADKMRGEK